MSDVREPRQAFAAWTGHMRDKLPDPKDSVRQDRPKNEIGVLKLLRLGVYGALAFGLAALLGAGIGGLIARTRPNDRAPLLESPSTSRRSGPGAPSAAVAGRDRSSYSARGVAAAALNLPKDTIS